MKQFYWTNGVIVFGEKPKRLRCGLCGRMFATKQGAIVHATHYHDITKEKLDAAKKREVEGDDLREHPRDASLGLSAETSGGGSA